VLGMPIYLAILRMRHALEPYSCQNCLLSLQIPLWIKDMALMLNLFTMLIQHP